MVEYKRRALITSASSGIGKETTLAFASSGIDVALPSRSADKLAAITDAVTKIRVKAKRTAVDLANLSKVEEQICQAGLDFGSIDILVNNTGMGYTDTLS